MLVLRVIERFTGCDRRIAVSREFKDGEVFAPKDLAGRARVSYVILIDQEGVISPLCWKALFRASDPSDRSAYLDANLKCAGKVTFYLCCRNGGYEQKLLFEVLEIKIKDICGEVYTEIFDSLGLIKNVVFIEINSLKAEIWILIEAVFDRLKHTVGDAEQ